MDGKRPRQLLTFANQLVTVNDLLINDLRQRCDAIHNAPLCGSGHKVGLKEGPFRNYKAIFQEYDGDEQAVILRTLLGQQNELLVELNESSQPKVLQPGNNEAITGTIREEP